MGHRRRERHPEHGLEEGDELGCRGGYRLERARRFIRVLPETAQESGRRLGQLERRSGCGDAAEDGAELEQGVIAGLRQRGVARCPTRGDRETEDALLRAADAVEAPALVVEDLAAALVEEVVAAHGVRLLLAQPAGADVSAGLLVGHEDELEVSPGGSPALTSERHACDRLGRDLRLHVERAAAPEEPVREVARPRVVAPLRGVGEHGVDVAEVAQGRPVDGAVQVGDEVGPGVFGGEEANLEAGLAQVAGQVLDGHALVARRVDRVEAHEALEDRRGL